MHTNNFYYKIKGYIWNKKIRRLFRYRNNNIIVNLPSIKIKNGEGLDIGTLDGKLLGCLSRRFKCKFIGLDIQKRTIKGYKIIQANASKIPLKDNSVDIITAFSLIEHLKNHERIKFYKEALRLLKINGHIIIQIPNRFFPIEHHSFLPLAGYLPSGLHKYLFNEYYLNLKSKDYYLKELNKYFDITIKSYEFPKEFSPFFYKLLKSLKFFNLFPFGYIIVGVKR